MPRNAPRPMSDKEFENAVVREIPKLRRYARMLLRDSDRSEDLVQDTLTRCFIKRHLWERGSDLRAWMFTVMHSQYVNLVRSSIRQGSRIGVTDTLINHSPSLHYSARQTTALVMRDLRRAMATIPAKQRVAIELIALENMNYEDAAELLGVPVGTVRSRLSRGRDALRELLGLEQRERCEARSRPRRRPESDPQEPAEVAVTAKLLDASKRAP